MRQAVSKMLEMRRAAAGGLVAFVLVLAGLILASGPAQARAGAAWQHLVPQQGNSSVKQALSERRSSPSSRLDVVWVAGTDQPATPAANTLQATAAETTGPSATPEPEETPAPAGQPPLPPVAGAGPGSSGSWLAAPQPPVRRSVPALPDWVQELRVEAAAPTAGALAISEVASTGSGRAGIVYNGDSITYTLAITNTDAAILTDILILDVPAEDTLDRITCTGNCYQVAEVTLVPEPLGGTIPVTITRQISWTLASLAPGQSIQMAFSGRVYGQADGTVLSNRAYVRYRLGTTYKSAMSNEVQTATRSRIHEGGATLSNAPTWLSKDLGGTLSMDWGDFDGDGYLDLALGSTTGTTVYRNEDGHLVKFWGNERYTLGVRWADLQGDGKQELIAVGDSTGSETSARGRNYIFQLSGDTFAETAFDSDSQLLRIEPGDFDGDGQMELVASTNAINAPCAVLLYLYRGGNFTPANPVCVSHDATAALAVADYNHDGAPDLVLGAFPNQTELLTNGWPQPGGVGNNPFAGQQPIVIDNSTTFLPYDFAWGDYDGDGYLDLAAAYPLERRLRIYHNEAGTGLKLAKELRTNSFRTPLAIRWGDFDGDGRLDLAVADTPPRIYLNTGNGLAAERYMLLPADLAKNQIWSMAPADVANEGHLGLALGNRDGASLLFSAFSSALSPDLTPVVAWSASSVAWGDADGDGHLDLLLGAGAETTAARLYYNRQGTFASRDSFPSTGFGPHGVAFGDLHGTGKLAIALGTGGDTEVYDQGTFTAPQWRSSLPATSLAWGDADGDGNLDLLAGTDNHVVLYRNLAGKLAETPSWISTETLTQPSIAWGDFDSDGYLDFAAGSYGDVTRVYRNQRDGTFAQVWQSPVKANTTAVAWADADGDGYLDLAMANYGEATVLYRHAGGTLERDPIWRSNTTYRKSTSLAWGDWNNDGKPDLALGNDGEPVQVYTNLGSRPGAPQLVWLWRSSVAYRATGVAWGDMEGDGDLDLAVSQLGGGASGYFVNHYSNPAHLASPFTQALPLPGNPAYLTLARPGSTDRAGPFSSAEILSGPVFPTVTIPFQLYDPALSRANPGADTAGRRIGTASYQYSLDGGGTWHPATGVASPITSTSRLGQEGTFQWNAQADAAISDDARFRITVVPLNQAGPVQRAAVSAISPAFRVRGTTCIWPVNPTIAAGKAQVLPGEAVRFEGSIAKGSGVMTFTWDFGDGATERGQVVQHVFDTTGQHLVRLTVNSEACPVSRFVATTVSLQVGYPRKVYLPALLNGSQNAASGVTWSGYWDSLDGNHAGAGR